MWIDGRLGSSTAFESNTNRPAARRSKAVLRCRTSALESLPEKVNNCQERECQVKPHSRNKCDHKLALLSRSPGCNRPVATALLPAPDPRWLTDSPPANPQRS